MSFHNNGQELPCSNNPELLRQRTDSMNSSSQRYPSVSNLQRAPSVTSARNHSGDKFTPIANSIESSVTKLLVITKQLLESLTKWSKQLAEPDDVSAIYIRLVTEFNMTIRIFKEVGIESLDLEDFPFELRSILEETLAEIPSTESLQRHLPHVREIIMHLLKSLKYKQSLYKSRFLRPRKESQASRGSEENTSRKGSSEYAFCTRSTNFESFLGPPAFPDTPNALNALKQSSSLERRASKRLSKMNKSVQQGPNDDIQRNKITVESVRDLLTDSQAADIKSLDTSVKSPTEESRFDKLNHLSEDNGTKDFNIGRSPNSGFPNSNSLKSGDPSYAYKLNNQNTSDLSKNNQRTPQRSMTTSSGTRSFSSNKTTSPKYVPSSTPVLLPRSRSFTSPIPNEASSALESKSETPQEIKTPSRAVESLEETHNRDPQSLQENKVSQVNTIEMVSLPQQPMGANSTLSKLNRETRDYLNEEDAETKHPFADLNVKASSNEISEGFKHDSLEELDRLVKTNNNLNIDGGGAKAPINEEKNENEYPPVDERPLPSGNMEVANDRSEMPKEERRPIDNREFTDKNDESLHKQEDVREFERNHGSFVYYLKFNNKTYKVVSSSVVDTQEKLEALFQSKFGNEFIDFSFEFYIEDYDTKVNYLLEDYSDMKPKSLVVAQKEQLKTKEESPANGAKAMVETARSHEEPPNEEIESPPLFQELLQRLINIERKLGNKHTTNVPFQLSSPIKDSKRGRLVTDSTNYQKVKSMQLELASLKQVFATSFAKIPLQLNDFRNQMNIINRKASGFGFDRGYILRSKDSIEAAAKSLVKRFDDINDQIELLRSDVLLRKVRPGLDQTSYLNKEKEFIENNIRSLQKSIEEVTPTWKKQWEKELNAIVQEQEFLDNHTSLVADLNKDFDSVTTVLSNVSAIAQLQAKSGIKSKPLAVKPASGDIKGIREQIHTDVLKLRPDSDVRLQAIERFEAFQRKKVLLHEDEFEKEIQDFINDDRLRKIGGVEEIERRRLVQDEQNRKLLWKGAFNNTEKSISTEDEKRDYNAKSLPTNAHSGIPNFSQVDTTYDGVSSESRDAMKNSNAPPYITDDEAGHAEKEETGPSLMDMARNVSSDSLDAMKNSNAPSSITDDEAGHAEEKETGSSLTDMARNASSDSLDAMKNSNAPPSITDDEAGHAEEEETGPSLMNMARNASSDSLDAMKNSNVPPSITHDEAGHAEEKETGSSLTDIVHNASSESQEDNHSSTDVDLPSTTNLFGFDHAEEKIGPTEKGIDPSQPYDAYDKVSSELPKKLGDTSDVILPSTGPRITEERETNEKGTVPRVGHHRRNDTISTDDYEAYQDAEDEDNSLT
ncbi:actin nucleation-promoting factor Bud6/Aip3 [Schizosaccharomyces osmophilus]|uniref:Actin nucleation-promoting factor Bud6/Aip3 n=1 Tax=Schizosaccharomyces osmophilus TaxID=2545709 RepID=A0AAE9WCA9_9SCHI|nr:actin nucleation-promoting factor Bud6/Aip3 [Schizosaccharomyces osmophilus]WBW73747.1 actin nucleation-promoting factor Bud6/Aip3 [Schizosaccharomyces osmophilus]